MNIAVSGQPMGKFDGVPEEGAKSEAFSVRGGRGYAHVTQGSRADSLEVEVIRQVAKEHLERCVPELIDKEMKRAVPTQGDQKGATTSKILSGESLQRPAGPLVCDELRERLLNWKRATESTGKDVKEDFFPASNETTASGLDPIWNIQRLMSLSHAYQNNIVIGVGGLLNLDIVLARMKANPEKKFFLLVVDINSDYEKFWEDICDVLISTPDVEVGRAAINRVIGRFGGLWGGKEELTCYFLSEQTNWDQARKLAREEKILFGHFDMCSHEESRQLRELIDSSGYYVDTYNVSNVAGVSEEGSSPGVAALSRAGEELMMPGSLLIASKIYYSTIEEEGKLFRSDEGYCVQSVIPFACVESLPKMLENPQKFENPDWFLQDVRMIIDRGHPEMPRALMQLAQKMPRELITSLFQEIFNRLLLEPTDGIEKFMTMIAEGKGSLEAEKMNYLRAIRSALEGIDHESALYRKYLKNWFGGL
ncbi:hypothetical protein [Estrella lausannensis]|nr:hypothetical protein [Estrella lausannensis]